MELTNGEITIRALRYADKERLAHLANSKKIWRNLRDMFPHPYRVDDAVRFIDSVKQQDPQVTFAIDYQHQLAGVIGMILQQDVYRHNAEVGYWIGEKYWKQGIASAALKMICGYAFKDLKVERLFAGIFEGNKGSQRVLEKCGFRQEGIMRKAVFKENKYLNEVRFGLLKEEFENL